MLIWLSHNYEFVLNLLLVLVALLIGVAQHYNLLKGKALAGMLGAKKLAKDGLLSGGQAQEDWVVTTIYPLLPAQIRLFVSEAAFRALVQRLYGTAMVVVDANTPTEPAPVDAPEGGAVAGP